MTSAPIVITSELLSQREARNVVMISSEEILRLRTNAYTSSKTEIGFLIRQPSAAAILQNFVELQLDLQYTLERIGADGTTAAACAVAPKITLQRGGADAGAVRNQCFGMQMEGFPFQSKCCRTAVVSLNGASSTYRCSEYMKEFLLPQASKAYMAKVGGDWNDYTDQYAYNRAFDVALGQEDHRDLDENPVVSATTARQYEEWRYSMLRDGTRDNAFLAAGGQAPAAGGAGVDKTHTLTHTEPLCLAMFGGLGGNEQFPTWSSQQNISPSLLHVNQLQINFQMLDNWKQNMFGMIQGTEDGQLLRIKDVDIISARLNTKWVMPPPRMIASALSAQVSYASWGALRFKLNPQSNVATHSMTPTGDNSIHDFTLNAVSWPHMPSVFCFSVAPDYNKKLNLIAAGNGDCKYQRLSKQDKRISIYEMDLIINTSADCIPREGGSGIASDTNVLRMRYNQRQLYDMTLRNCSSIEQFPYSFSEWKQHCPFVLMSSEDINGIVPSMHTAGQLSMQGTIKCKNNMGYTVYVGGANPGNAGAGAGWIQHFPYEKFEAQVVGFYCNRYIQLDAKSGMVGESVLSEQFANSLRLAGGAQ